MPLLKKINICREFCFSVYDWEHRQNKLYKPFQWKRFYDVQSLTDQLNYEINQSINFARSLCPDVYVL